MSETDPQADVEKLEDELCKLSLDDLGFKIMRGGFNPDIEHFGSVQALSELSILCSAIIRKFDGSVSLIELEYYRAQHNFMTNPSCHHWNCLVAMMMAWQGIQDSVLERGRRGRR